MNKTILTTAVATVLGASSFAANATSAIVAGTTNLSITDGGTGVVSCVLGTAPPCTNTLFNQTGNTGSFFNLGSDTLLEGGDGINIGVAQVANPDAYHGGGLNGTETPAITKSWEFNGNTGTNGTNNATGIGVNDANTLDFSAWSVSWSGLADIPMGGDTANFASDTGLATIVCSTVGVCADGDTYTLDYSAHVPLNDASGFGGALYTLHLEGIVSTPSAVPVPAAVWLFGSGLLGLVGVARRKSKV